jgi:subtilisin family serine protease
MLRTRSVFAIALFTLAGSALANEPGTLMLKAGDVRVDDATNMLRANQARAQRLPERMVLVLDGPMTPLKRERIEGAGVRVGDYLPTNAFIVDTTDARIGALRALGFVESLIEFDNAWKIDPIIGNRQLISEERQVFADQGKVASHVYLFAGASIVEGRKAIERLGGVEIMNQELVGDRFMLGVLGTEENVRKLAEISDVQWIESAPEITFRNNSTRWIVQSNVNGFFPMYDNGLRGENQLVAIMDGRVDVNHCAFSDPEGDPIGPDHRKIEAYNSSLGSDFHGTHVAGTVLGDNGGENHNRGIAYNARMIFDRTPSFTFTSLNSHLTTHYNQGASIHTNSWGDDGVTNYTGMCRAIDTFSHVNDDNLVIFAATNTSTLKTPENSKNVLAVGATQDANSQGSFCSGGRGPTFDGRRKPEIFAPGCNSQSAQWNTSCGTFGLTGTSMAAPAIAGTAALTRQYFEEGYYPSGVPTFDDGFTPSGTLIKATLLNSSVNMTGIGGFPSNQEGWGRVLLDNALHFPGDDENLIIRDVRNSSGDALETAESAEFVVNNDSFSVPFKVTLVWHDAPGTPNSSFPPVNNLDLELVMPSGQVVYGNNVVNGQSTFDTTTDEVNNVEMVVFPAIPAGEYTIRVNGTAVNLGPQGYALVVTGAVSEIAATCLADLNDDGNLDFFDVSAFLTAYNAQDPSADFNDDGQFNFFDVSAFLSAFNAGCP